MCSHYNFTNKINNSQKNWGGGGINSIRRIIIKPFSQLSISFSPTNLFTAISDHFRLNFHFSFPSHSPSSHASDLPIYHQCLATINIKLFLTDIAVLLPEHPNPSVTTDASPCTIPQPFPSMPLHHLFPKLLLLARLPSSWIFHNLFTLKKNASYAESFSSSSRHYCSFIYISKLDAYETSMVPR